MHQQKLPPPKRTKESTDLQHTTCSIFTGRYLDNMSDVLLIRHLLRSVRSVSVLHSANNSSKHFQTHGLCSAGVNISAVLGGGVSWCLSYALLHDRAELLLDFRRENAKYISKFCPLPAEDMVPANPCGKIQSG